MAAMANAMEAISGSLNATYKAMAANMERSMSMAASMNGMMEQYVCRSVEISSRVLPAAAEKVSSGGVTVVLNVSNHSRVPVVCSLAIRGEVPDTKASIPLKVEALKMPSRDQKGSSKSSAGSKVKAESKAGGAAVAASGAGRGGFLIDKGFTLGPGKQSWKLRVEVAQMVQCNALVELTFASPGTGKPLQVRHAFGLYLIHRCRREWLKTHTERVGSAVALELDCYFVRRFFRIPHSEGISKGNALKLSVAGHSLMLVVDAISGNTVKMQVLMLGADAPSEEILEKILLELDMASKAFCDRSRTIL